MHPLPQYLFVLLIAFLVNYFCIDAKTRTFPLFNDDDDDEGITSEESLFSRTRRSRFLKTKSEEDVAEDFMRVIEYAVTEKPAMDRAIRNLTASSLRTLGDLWESVETVSADLAKRNRKLAKEDLSRITDASLVLLQAPNPHIVASVLELVGRLAQRHADYLSERNARAAALIAGAKFEEHADVSSAACFALAWLKPADKMAKIPLDRTAGKHAAGSIVMRALQIFAEKDKGLALRCLGAVVRLTEDDKHGLFVYETGKSPTFLIEEILHRRVMSPYERSRDEEVFGLAAAAVGNILVNAEKLEVNGMRVLMRYFGNFLSKPDLGGRQGERFILGTSFIVAQLTVEKSKPPHAEMMETVASAMIQAAVGGDSGLLLPREAGANATTLDDFAYSFCMTFSVLTANKENRKTLMGKYGLDRALRVVLAHESMRRSERAATACALVLSQCAANDEAAQVALSSPSPPLSSSSSSGNKDRGERSAIESLASILVVHCGRDDDEAPATKKTSTIQAEAKATEKRELQRRKARFVMEKAAEAAYNLVAQRAEKVRAADGAGLERLTRAFQTCEKRVFGTDAEERRKFFEGETGKVYSILSRILSS